MSETPIEVMKKSHLVEAGRWTVASSDDGIVVARFDAGEWEVIETHEDIKTAMERRTFLAFDAGYRAALRALTEMEPTQEMTDAANAGEDELGYPVFVVKEARDYILAAAEEGQQK